jgi:hypothetical protein
MVSMQVGLIDYSPSSPLVANTHRDDIGSRWLDGTSEFCVLQM